ncbi:MAG: Transporter [Nocardioides sp.]|nr:Transporter [Nocardioides sp.]
MQGVLDGFATIGALVLLGMLLAHLGVMDLPAQRVLSRLAFYVASPALMVTVLEDTDVTDVFSAALVAAAAGVAVAGTLYAVTARLVLRRGVADTVVGTLCASYVNAGNLGLPIAAYALGDASLVAPTLLMQLLVMQPVALAVLDAAAGERRLSVLSLAVRPLRTPLTVASLVGLAVSVTGLEIPRVVHDPLALVGGMAVPAVLIAYGVSLRLGPLPGRGVETRDLALVTVLKLVAQPLAAYATARYGFGLEGNALLSVAVISALPTAQNVFVYASFYQRSTLLSRDSVFVTTVLAVPTVLVITAALT